jgi:hypothetical protein
MLCCVGGSVRTGGRHVLRNWQWDSTIERLERSMRELLDATRSQA